MSLHIFERVCAPSQGFRVKGLGSRNLCWVQELDGEALALFGRGAALSAHELGPPTASARSEMFADVCAALAAPPAPPVPRVRKAPPPQVNSKP